MGFASLVESLRALFSTKIQETNATSRRYMELRSDLHRQNNALRASFFSNLFKRENLKIANRHQRRMVKLNAKEERRTIAMKRGYW